MASDGWCRFISFSKSRNLDNQPIIYEPNVRQISLYANKTERKLVLQKSRVLKMTTEYF